MHMISMLWKHVELVVVLVGAALMAIAIVALRSFVTHVVSPGIQPSVFLHSPEVQSQMSLVDLGYVGMALIWIGVFIKIMGLPDFL